jgi:hypothetical protein
MPVVSVVCCHAEVSASGRSLVQRSPIDCGVALSVMMKTRYGGSRGLLGSVAPWGVVVLQMSILSS